MPTAPIAPSPSAAADFVLEARGLGFVGARAELIASVFEDGPEHAHTFGASSACPVSRKIYRLGNSGYDGESERWWIVPSRNALVTKVARRKDFDLVVASEMEPEREPLPALRRGPYALTAIAARTRSKALVLCGDAEEQFGRVATRGAKVPKRPTFQEFDRAPRTFGGKGLVASRFWIQIDLGYDSRPSRAALTRHGVELAAPGLVGP